MHVETITRRDLILPRRPRHAIATAIIEYKNPSPQRGTMMGTARQVHPSVSTGGLSREQVHRPRPAYVSLSPPDQGKPIVRTPAAAKSPKK